jgi:hypothetical protein
VRVDLPGNPRVLANHACQGKGVGLVDMGAFEFTGVISACPRLKIGSVKHKGKHVTVKVGCQRTRSFCDGTLSLKTVAKFGGRRRGLGKQHFHVRSGHTGRVTIILSTSGLSALGGEKSLKVVVLAKAKDAAGNHAKAKRTVKLKLG